MLDNLVDSSDLEHSEILRLNNQKECDPIPNLGDNDNSSVGQEEYRKIRGVKNSKACKKRQDGRVEQVKKDRISKVRVRHIF